MSVFLLTRNPAYPIVCARSLAHTEDGTAFPPFGGYFGGYVKPANKRENRVDRRLRRNQSGKRKVVVVIRERNGKTLPGVFRSEAEALNFIRRSVPASTTLYADEAGSWNDLHAR
jgi:hypothetical protein